MQARRSMIAWSQRETRPGGKGRPAFCFMAKKDKPEEAQAPEPKEEIEISPRRLLEAALHKAWVTIRTDDKLTKATMDGVVQLLKLYREYAPQDDVPTKYRVEWLTKKEYDSLTD